MNMRKSISLLALAASLAASASVAAGVRPLATEIIIDCQTRALPSQAQVSSMLGVDNFSEAYAARSRLMANAARACQRPGTEMVRITRAPASSQTRSSGVAKAEHSPRR